MSLSTAWILILTKRSLIFSKLAFLRALNVSSSVILVRPEGLEPPAHGLEIRCSFQLSYGREFLAEIESRCRRHVGACHPIPPVVIHGNVFTEQECFAFDCVHFLSSLCIFYRYSITTSKGALFQQFFEFCRSHSLQPFFQTIGAIVVGLLHVVITTREMAITYWISIFSVLPIHNGMGYPIIRSYGRNQEPFVPADLYITIRVNNLGAQLNSLDDCNLLNVHIRTTLPARQCR